jgi:hypothetical protein
MSEVSPHIAVFRPEQLAEAIPVAAYPDVDLVIIRGMMPAEEVRAFNPTQRCATPTARQLVDALSDPAIVPGVHAYYHGPFGGERTPFGSIEHVSVEVGVGPRRAHLDEPIFPVSASVTLPPLYDPTKDRTIFMAERVADYYTPFLAVKPAFETWLARRRLPRSRIELRAGDLAIVSYGVAHQVASDPRRRALLPATQSTWYPGAYAHLDRSLMAR